eukprot:scaffold4243_cov112-Isochrysis_galbana.AAC.4
MGRSSHSNAARWSTFTSLSPSIYSSTEPTEPRFRSLGLLTLVPRTPPRHSWLENSSRGVGIPARQRVAFARAVYSRAQTTVSLAHASAGPAPSEPPPPRRPSAFHTYPRESEGEQQPKDQSHHRCPDQIRGEGAGVPGVGVGQGPGLAEVERRHEQRVAHIRSEGQLAPDLHRPPAEKGVGQGRLAGEADPVRAEDSGEHDHRRKAAQADGHTRRTSHAHRRPLTSVTGGAVGCVIGAIEQPGGGAPGCALLQLRPQRREADADQEWLGASPRLYVEPCEVGHVEEWASGVVIDGGDGRVCRSRPCQQQTERRPAEPVGEHKREDHQGRDQVKLHVVGQIPEMALAPAELGLRIVEADQILDVEQVDPPPAGGARLPLGFGEEVERPPYGRGHRDRHHRSQPDPPAQRVHWVESEPSDAPGRHLPEQSKGGEHAGDPEKGVDREEGGGHQLVGEAGKAPALGRDRDVTESRGREPICPALGQYLRGVLGAAHADGVDHSVAKYDPGHRECSDAVQAVHRAVVPQAAQGRPVALEREAAQRGASQRKVVVGTRRGRGYGSVACRTAWPLRSAPGRRTRRAAAGATRRRASPNRPWTPSVLRPPGLNRQRRDGGGCMVATPRAAVAHIGASRHRHQRHQKSKDNDQAPADGIQRLALRANMDGEARRRHHAP